MSVERTKGFLGLKIILWVLVGHQKIMHRALCWRILVISLRLHPGRLFEQADGVPVHSKSCLFEMGYPHIVVAACQSDDEGPFLRAHGVSALAYFCNCLGGPEDVVVTPWEEAEGDVRKAEVVRSLVCLHPLLVLEQGNDVARLRLDSLIAKKKKVEFQNSEKKNKASLVGDSNTAKQ